MTQEKCAETRKEICFVLSENGTNNPEPEFRFRPTYRPNNLKRKHVHRNNTATPEKFLSQMFEPTTTETVFIVVKDVVSFGSPVRAEQVWLGKFHCAWPDKMPFLTPPAQ